MHYHSLYLRPMLSTIIPRNSQSLHSQAVNLAIVVACSLYYTYYRCRNHSNSRPYHMLPICHKTVCHKWTFTVENLEKAEHSFTLQPPLIFPFQTINWRCVEHWCIWQSFPWKSRNFLGNLFMPKRSILFCCRLVSSILFLCRKSKWFFWKEATRTTKPFGLTRCNCFCSPHFS